MGVFRFIDRWQTSLVEKWRASMGDDGALGDLMARLEQRDLDLEAWLDVYVPTIPRCSLGKSGAQSIPNNTLTALTWDVEAYDTTSIHDLAVNTSRMTVPAGFGGLWRFGYSADFAANAVGTRLFYIARNGSVTRYAFNEDSGAAGVNTSGTGSVDLSMAVGDYVEVIVFQNSGAALNCGVNAHGYATFVSP